MTKLPPLTTQGKAAPRRSRLETRFQFSPELANTMERELGNSVSTQLASRSLHIKGMGFNRSQIAELALSLGHEAGSLDAWRGVSKLVAAADGDTDIAVAAYRAGLTPDQLRSMDPASRTVERLSLMSELRSL